ncbi:hypothetical protein FE257_011420 [Aspergillus nanangensis]|uniref:Methyltransferase domain-containing protein n=1 Tax=Aspergillus nanangensis TaxID=2582783 RepID=A0AAD4GSL0_ASPNN|nr:hypothetical protein FE257_011420 [Aspergillus nanangensis]
MTGAQYDKIGDRYNDLTNIATGKLQLFAIQTLIGDIKGLRILELACGTGLYARKAIEWGACKAVGVDISQAMVDAARVQAQGDERLEFHVADCGQPLDLGQYDVVLVPWLLNYASNEEELLAMWRNIYNCLKPGGRLLGICPNLDLVQSKVFPEGPQFGQSLQILDNLEGGGLRVQATLHTERPFSFSQYYLPRELYEKTGKLAGMRNLQWTPLENLDFPDVNSERFLLCPPFKTFTATRPVD